MGALQNQYADRKIRKREMRSLWIQRINAGAREHGLKYNDLIHGTNLANITLDRKILAELAVTEPVSFRSVVDKAREALLSAHPVPPPPPPAAAAGGAAKRQTCADKSRAREERLAAKRLVDDKP